MEFDLDNDLKKTQPDKKYVWDLLGQYASELFCSDDFSLSTTLNACGIALNARWQHITKKIESALVLLSEQSNLKQKINHLFQAKIVNKSELQPALHVALRSTNDSIFLVDNRNIMIDILRAREQIKQISTAVRNGEWLGYSGEVITDIVNIGIGGSDLGARFSLQVFSHIVHPGLRFHFVSDADSHAFERATHDLNPAKTLFIVASKSFTTQETLYNAKKAKAWVGEEHFEAHAIAVTANLEKAKAFGIGTVIPIWKWIGGRFSFCSAINLITAIAIGYDGFSQLLAGANAMDEHFRNTAFHANLPVMFALIGIWNNNFLHIHNLLMLTYSQNLDGFVPYIQQLEMESNGKSRDHNNNKISYSTCPIIWGGPGNQAQHSYYQLLCQGTHRVTIDLISVALSENSLLNEMCSNKIRVLTDGANDSAYGHIEGNISLNHLSIKDCSPYTIGALVALYEHKVYVQSVIWDINPFDQPGVESAKRKHIILNSTDLEVSAI